MQTSNEYIELWKKHNIGKCVMTFSCGGDSMNDTSFALYDNEDNEVQVAELTDYFESVIYDRVDFYEVSDGHYMGEFGTVEITYDEEEDEEDFLYYKDAKSEWEESFSGTMEVQLSDEELKLLEEKIENINYSEWDGEVNINFKGECVLTDEDEELLNNLTERIRSDANDFDIDGKGDDVGDGRNFDTGEDGEGCNIEDGVLRVNVSGRFYYTEESDF